MKNRQPLFKALRNNIPVRLNDELGYLSLASNNCIKFVTNGHEKFIRLPKAGLIDYGYGHIRLYAGGYRMMTSEERELYSEWIRSCDTNSIIQKMQFFKNYNKTYLVGLGEVNGKMLDRHRWDTGEIRCVYDDRIRGALLYDFVLQ